MTKLRCAGPLLVALALAVTGCQGDGGSGPSNCVALAKGQFTAGCRGQRDWVIRSAAEHADFLAACNDPNMTAPPLPGPGEMLIVVAAMGGCESCPWISCVEAESGGVRVYFESDPNRDILCLLPNMVGAWTLVPLSNGPVRFDESEVSCEP